MIRYQCKTKIAVYARGEFLQDPEGFMTKLIIDENRKITGYKLWGITAGVEYKPTDNSYLRLEGRNLQMDKAQEIFYWDGKTRNKRLEVMMNLGVSF